MTHVFFFGDLFVTLKSLFPQVQPLALTSPCIL